jgi:hypothetical protein
MFLCAVARPRQHDDGYFDGKIACIPFIAEEAAKNNSKKRPRGTIELKTLKVNRKTYRDALIIMLHKLKQCWPGGAAASKQETIRVQQDNAGAHVLPNDKALMDAMAEGGWDIELVCQPAQSPDFNVLDLAFFRSIQSLQQTKQCRTIKELIASVEEAWEESTGETLEKVWVSLARHLEAAMLAGGHNKYKPPHHTKTRERGAQGPEPKPFPKHYPCSEEAVRAAEAAVRKLVADNDKI